MEDEDEERLRKIAQGGALLAEYRERQARREGKKKKSVSKCKQDVHSLKINQQSNETFINSSQCVESAGNPDSTKMRAGQIETQNEVFVKDPHGERREPAPESCHMPPMPVLHTHIKSLDVIQPEGEISSLADNHSSLEEEEFDNCSQQGAQSSQTCLEMMENELAGKQLTIEELTGELEERRATCGPEVMQRLYEFEAAVKQRDGIITQLIANLQQAHKEKDETMREFSKLTEQSQKLQIQFQHLQAGETLRSNTHSSTATELLHVKQQVMAQQQQLEEQDRLLKDHQKKEEEFKIQITVLQEKIKVCEMEQDKKVESANNKIEEKQAIIEALNTRLVEEEKKTAMLTNQVTTADQLVGDLKGQLEEKDQETKSLKLELADSKQKVEQSSIEMKQYMETVEELQKKNHEVNFSETGIMQKMEKETEQKLAQLQAELDEEYGKQIVQMKQELIKQHMNQIEDLKSQHKGEMENTLKLRGNPAVNEEQVKLLSATMNELNMKVQHTLYQKEKFREELRVVKLEKCALQSQSNALLEELNALRDQIQRAKQTISEQENKLNEAGKSLSMVEDLKAEVTAAFESRKELELKHEAEITNYKIKLEMLEKEKNAVLDKMAESQEAELDRLRTQLLFSHEEELSKLKEDLEVEHRLNIERLKDNLGLQYKMQIADLQKEMSKKMEAMQCEKDSLLSKQSQLILEITDLKDLQESRNFQMNEIKKEIETLRQEEKEKGTLEQEIQELQLKTEQLEKILKAKEEDLQEKCVELEAENSILKDEKKVLEDMVKVYAPVEEEEKLIALTSDTYTSKDCSWQKEIDMLRKEKEDLKQQCIHLSKEIEMQRNTFSFAEKNFEVNYQELQEEYACLLRARDIQTKQALEYEHKVKALTEELQLQRGGPVMQEGRRSQLTDAATFIAEPLEVRELVEKDNIEFMEKLKVTEQEKLELSEKLSALSEQLRQTRDEVNCLSAEVKLLSQDKEELLLRCKELEVPTNPKGIEDAAVCPAQLSSWKTELTTGTDAHSGGCDSKISKDLPEESKIMVEDKIPSKGSGEDLILPTRTTEPSHGLVEPFEKEKLEQELCALKSTQDDLRLQMEAQRICLSLVYSAHAEQVREYMEKQRDEALCSLRDELVSAQEKKMDELQKMHQCQLQALQTQETGGHKEPLPALIGRLEKAVSEECCSISESLNSFLDEHYTPLKCEMNVEEKENSNVYNQNRNLKLQEYRYQVQDFQGHVQTLLSKLSDEYSKLVVLQTRLSKDEDDTQNVDEGTPEETTLMRKAEDAAVDVNLCNERHALQKANSRLLKILLEVANTTAAVEETIGCHVFKILDRSSKAQPAPSLPWRTEADVCAKPGFHEEYGRVTDESLPSYPGNAISRNDGKWSNVTDKESDLSQQLGTSSFAGPEGDPENVQFMLNVSSRLQAAVEKLLEAISETSSQLEHAKVTQTQLVCETVRQKQEAAESLRCIEELQERLQDESSAREQLAVELNRAENIIDGYSDEKLAFEREIQEKSYVIDHLEQQLLCANQRLQELEAEQQQVQEERELLSRQKAAMREMAGPVEQRFLQETEKLMKEKLQVQCQAEKVHSELQNQVKILEIDVEEKISKLIEMEQEKNAEVTDLRQQNQALEKQLENLRKFVDEQTVDREHERDIFQMEIQKLEQQIKVVPRPQPPSEQQAREIEKLTGHLREKADQCSELLLHKEQLQREVQDRDAAIEELQCRRRELEHALLASAESTAEKNNQKQSGGVETDPGLSLEVQLQAERDAIDRKEKEISNLEEQLEQFREELENKNDEVQELHMQLEIQRKESTTRLQELQQENKLYQDEMKKLEFIVKESDPTPLPDQPTLFGKFAQIIQEKDAKIDQLNEQLAKVHHQLKLATDKEASSTPALTYSNARQTREISSSDSDSELDQAFDIASEGQEECESSPVVPKVVKGLLRAVHTEGIQMLSIADLPDDDGQDPSKGTEYQMSVECVQSREEAADTASQELLDCSMQQSGKLETKEQPCSMKDKMAKLQEQLSSEKTVVSKLKYALSQTQLELEATLKVQHKHIKDLEAFRLKVQDKVDDGHLLTDTLENEQMKSQELQCALATEKAKSGHSEEQDEELKDLRFILEDQKQRNIHLDILLGQQKQLLNDLQEKMESQKILHNAQLSEEQGRNIMLQVLLESEKVRIRELTESLDKERELHAQLKNRGDDLQPQPVVPPAELLQYLQEQVEEKQKRIIELVNESQKYKLDSLETKYQMEKDRQIHQKTLQLEKEANNLGQRKMEELQGKVEELQLQLEEKRHQVHKLDLEGKRLQAIMQEFQNQELGREEKRRSKRLVYQNINEEATWNVTDDRTRNWVLQQKMEETKNTSYAKVIETNGGAIVSYNDVDVIRQKLQHLATKLQLHIAQKACNRQEFEVSDEDVLNWVRERIDRLILRVQRLTSCPHNEHSLVSSSTSCTETILRQNSELTGHVNQLTEEKNNLRNIIMQLEEQIKFYQQTSADRNCFSRFSFDGSASIKDIIASEKEVWSNEKLTLQKSLQRAEAKVCRLKDELKNDTLHQNRSPENAVLKRIYGKYLRAESFRKALVFQKKYLLLLLGRFQECEEATVGLLFHMTGFPGFSNPETGTSRPKGLAIFRRAIRVSIAITRMKYLVRRWHRVKASGPNNVNRDGFGVGPGVERTDPLYHSTSGLELYPDPRQMTHYSSRSDLDFPRSPLPFNRYPGTLADFHPVLTNPQLQQYNPGRTLTDYVTQIDALQRRLGTTLQSGSPASQYHTGMRR
ncbi:A-kinase anchor protein 9 isoform X7 [Arvicola amphibius]|uniref:A-kinase anchor protein 9 isoform X7 n=1 Tax=Arvicola amphibius TaxID=1047088 RepID=UPI0018E3D550|nr:A-kinase anchor protein 9 isoform X7 [Arvicola amphibius]